MIDRNTLKRLGWSDELIRAAEQVAKNNEKVNRDISDTMQKTMLSSREQVASNICLYVTEPVTTDRISIRRKK